MIFRNFTVLSALSFLLFDPTFNEGLHFDLERLSLPLCSFQAMDGYGEFRVTFGFFREIRPLPYSIRLSWRNAALHVSFFKWSPSNGGFLVPLHLGY